MNFRVAFRIAWRYLRGKRAANTVPILSRISMAAIAVVSGALVILFSVFNGFNAFIDGFYTSFYSDLRIRPAQGKTFILTEAQQQLLQKTPGIEAFSPVLEDRVLASGEGQGIVVNMRGIGPNYFRVANLKPYIRTGIDSLNLNEVMPEALVGLGVAGRLGLSAENVFSQLHLHYPNPAAPVSGLSDPATAFHSLTLKPQSIFAVQSEFDDQYILTALPNAQELLGAGTAISSIEMKVDSGRATAVIESLKKSFGKDFKVENRRQQNPTFYAVMATEKWAVYLILLLVLLIASFNLIGALSMLIMDKQKDVAMLQAMGADTFTIRLIFLLESIFWSLIGGVIGVTLGVLICLGQQHFGWIKMQGGFLIDTYPVALQATDLGVVLLTAFALGILAGIVPAWRAARQQYGILR